MIVKIVTPEIVEIDAPAKINLSLEVLGKRADGYHDIYSLFQAVSLFDHLRFELSEKPECLIELTDTCDLSTGPDNLICRAYNLLRDKFSLTHGLKVRLEKNIPLAAGLGGGSADAAATILAVNILFDLALSNTEMAGLGAEIGSDLPFFFTSGQALVSGRGEVTEEVELPTDYCLVLVNPNFPISTATAFSSLGKGLTNSAVKRTFLVSRTLDGLVRFLSLSGNDFEIVHFQSYPILDEIRNELNRCGATLVRMSGSGPTMFGLFDKTSQPDISSIVGRGNWQIFTVKPVSFSLNKHEMPEGGNRGDYRSAGDVADRGPA